MKGNTNGRLRKPRGTRIYKLAPTTRAIRGVLAGSATLLALALAGNGVAYAGTCLNTDATTVSCNEDFTETLPGTLFVPPTDLTLVLGDTAPTSVTTAVGDVGVDATWSGSIGIVSNADITTDGADGVHAYGSTAGAGATFENRGTVATSVTANGANAVDIDAYGDVTVLNGGDLLANGVGSYDVTTVTAYSVDGVTTIDNLATGTIGANAVDGNALGVNAFGFYGTVVNNEGAILGTSVNGTATGVFVEAFADTLGGGIAEVNNGGTIEVSSDYSQAIGVQAYARSTSAVIGNAGAISASGYDLAVGISTYATATTAIDSSGSIVVVATAGDAYGISAASDWDSISIGNSGDISAQAYGQAAGIVSAGYRGDIVNSGSVVATVENGTASAISARDYYSSSVSNSGSLQATSLLGNAVGVDASSSLLVDVDNSGSIVAGADGDASGIIAASLFGTNVDNSGTITVSANFGNAVGIVNEVLGGPYAYENAIVDNSGSVSAISEIGDATGIAVTADLPFGVVYNSGSVSATSSQGAATGITVQTDASISSSYVLNDGIVDALASGEHGLAQGVSVYANDGDSFVITSGSISATAGLSGIAYGVNAFSQNGSTRVDNSGDITVATTPVNVAEFTTEIDFATGIYAGSEDLSTVSNSGRITVDGGWQALGIEVRADDGLVSVSNAATGIIDVTGSRTAHGISTYVDSYGTDPFTNSATMDNAGSISVRTTGEIVDVNGYAFGNSATGMNAVLKFGDDVSITNSGSISIVASNVARGIRADTLGDVSIANSGSIDIVGSGISSSYGIEGYSVSGDVLLGNSGDITILSNALSAADVATGIDATAISRYEGDASVVNSGNIAIEGAFTAFGVHADAGLIGTGNVTVGNSGDISITTVGTAWGIDTMLWKYDGDTLIDNTGDISVTGSDARGIRAGQSSDVGDLSISNAGDISAVIDPTDGFYVEGAIGIFARRYSFDAGGIVDIDNSGAIQAIADIGDSIPGFRGAHAHGMQVFTYSNQIGISNSGAILAELSSAGDKGATALGIFVKNGYGTSFGDIGISNTGSIETSITANDAVSPYTFLYYSGAYTAGIHARATYGDVNVDNAGSISANALSDYNPDSGVTRASGISVLSQVGRGVERDLDLGDLTIGNTVTGSIQAHSQADYGDSAVIAAGISTLVSVGDYGSLLVSAGHGIDIENGGVVSAIAVNGENATGSATATAISATNESAEGFAGVVNTGRLNAEATTTGTATAIGLFASAADITVALGADSVVSATATGADGTAIGLSLNGVELTASNAGAIRAEFIGGGDTFGALIGSPTGEVAFTNSGIINAVDADYAVGVQLDSLVATTLNNSGTIAAFSTPEGGIAVRTGASMDAIANTGTIIGSVVTGDGDDTFDNALGGVWHAFGSSDFGSGDDAIDNAGTIRLNDASISLGEPGVLGNSFNNSGLITVSGDNLIQMGALNAFAFTNTGTINFQDGAPDDQLTIVGDFGGDGSINLDVSGLHGTSDLLYINGNVVEGSVNTINVNVLDLPTTVSSTAIDMIHVSGNSHAGNFTLGQVNYDPNASFLTLDFSLLASIDGSNATNDAFSLGVNAENPPVVEPPVVEPPVVEPPVVEPPVVEPPVVEPPVEDPDTLVLVSGLADSGTLAAAIAPGVQNLLGAQVGTARQRMGVIDKITRSGVNLWVRLFQNDGTLNPQHHADNFGQGGNFAYDQKNSGTEIGADFALSDEFSVGVLLAKAQAKQELTGTGIGSSKIDGDTLGAYATWLSPSGFYLDASYRRMDFDAKLRTGSGGIRTSGEANALNLEAGYAWTISNGLTIEPQLQYTHVQVDDIDELPGALARFQSDGGDSSLARLGVSVRKTFQDGSTAWTPYATVSAVREFDGENGFTISEDFSGHTSVEGTHALIEAGLNVDLGRLSLFGGAHWSDGGAQESIVGGQVGMRFSW